jgi:GH43 family beta-xylosidase
MLEARTTAWFVAAFFLGATSILAGACAEPATSTPHGSPDAGADDASSGSGGNGGALSSSSSSGSTSGAGGSMAACSTRITYGAEWIHGPNHPEDFDTAQDVVTWDGSCSFDGTNSFATLSNGWKPYFAGRSSCVIALDYDNCPQTPTTCETRVSYGPSWLPGPNHPALYDDVGDALLWNGVCRNDGANSFATLSNGWTPYFNGNGACDLSFRYTQCGGLYQNPVTTNDCADPGVIYDGTQYVMACTSGNAPDAFLLRTSPDLIHWEVRGSIFPAATKPAWAVSDFWAPEIHRVGNSFVAYYTARHVDGRLSIGAATAPSALGPYTDIGQPLLHDPGTGLIDANHYEDPSGKHYLIWKEDGNAVGIQTPIHGQELSANGLEFVGARKTLITNDLPWEGPLVEGPWLIDNAGKYYLFYSANAYNTPSYAIGVARADSPLGPYTKAPQSILSGAGHWAGPGHGSVITTKKGETWHVYHSWIAGQVGGGPGRVALIDRIFWENGWPTMRAAPSFQSLPVP